MAHAKTLALLALTTISPLLLGVAAAQDSRPTTSAKGTGDYRPLGDFAFRDPQSQVVKFSVEKLKALIQAGVEDGGDEHSMNQAFLTPETLASLPLRFRFYTPAAPAGSGRIKVGVQIDYQKSIDWGVVFRNRRINSVEGKDNMWSLGGNRLFFCEVERPDGGQRLNFGNLFGNDRESSLSNELLTTYVEIETRSRNPRLTSRLRQMPLYGRFNFGAVAFNEREARELSALFGPRAATLSAAVSMMGKRPVVDLYSDMRPGEGLVGTYLDRRPRHAGVTGSIAFAPSMILSTDLGQIVPRNLATMAKAAKRGTPPAIAEPMIEFCEAWTGAMTVVVRAKELPEEADDAAGNALEEWPSSFEGTVVFAVEEDSSEDLVAGLWKLLNDDVMKTIGDSFGLDLEVSGEGDQRVVKISPPGAASSWYLSLGSAEDLMSISVARSRIDCLDFRSVCLRKQGKYPAPTKFRMVQGGVKFWAGKRATRALPIMFQQISGFLLRGWPNRKALVLAGLRDLAAEDWSAALSWNARLGVMLRVMF